jgi:peptidoglycan/xylan/chitin deacetylase (PgdA/CDA1 family)
MIIQLKSEVYNEEYRKYVFDIVFGSLLGIDFQCKKNKRVNNDLEVIFPKSEKKLILKNNFSHEIFQCNPKDISFHINNYSFNLDFLRPPKILKDFEGLPIFFGGKEIIEDSEGIIIDIDILGSIFFMLSRIEELDITKVDEHQRFSAKESIAYKLGFLDRPIVDEYVELLWSMMKYLWPELKRKEATTEIIVGCDVDTPFDCSSVSISKLIRPLVGDLIKRRNLNQALTRVRRYFSFHRELEINKNLDPFYTFDYYMDVVEKAGLKATFFFIPDSKQPMNGCYDLEDKKILLLIKKITSRGHSIGLHGSYQSYSDRDILLNGKEKLYSVLNSIGISEPLIKNRQHYLRWDVKTTPDLLEEAGVDIDYSGGYADHAGFRYGTSKEFNLWSWEQNRMLNVIEQPLVIMECSIFDYQELPYNDVTMNYLKSLKQASMNYGGNFHMLWHNSYFMRPNDKEFFEVMLSNPE